jgi:hypothetical protein
MNRLVYGVPIRYAKIAKSYADFLVMGRMS